MARQIRSDKKFLIKVWCPTTNKNLFRSHCLEAHMSMMNVSEKMVIRILDNTSEKELKEIIEKRLSSFNNMRGMETVGFRVTDNYWQQLAKYAVFYETSVAKIGSCIFNYGLGSYELREVWEIFGLKIAKRRKLNEK